MEDNDMMIWYDIWSDVEDVTTNNMIYDWYDVDTGQYRFWTFLGWRVDQSSVQHGTYPIIKIKTVNTVNTKKLTWNPQKFSKKTHCFQTFQTKFLHVQVTVCGNFKTDWYKLCPKQGADRSFGLEAESLSGVGPGLETKIITVSTKWGFKNPGTGLLSSTMPSILASS